MENCTGPCLPHCYSENKITYIVIVIFIVLFFGSYIKNNLSKLLMENCNGPCLSHCYSENKIMYIFIGIFVGLFFGSYMLKNTNSQLKNLSNLK